jgi:hypothetical protein
MVALILGRLMHAVVANIISMASVVIPHDSAQQLCLDSLKERAIELFTGHLSLPGTRDETIYTLKGFLLGGLDLYTLTFTWNLHARKVTPQSRRVPSVRTLVM